MWEGSDPLFCAVDSPTQRLLVISHEPAVRLWHLPERDGAVAESDAPTAGQTIDWLRNQVADFSKPTGPFRRESTEGRPRLETEKDDLQWLHVREAASGADLFPPLSHQARVVDAVFSPDGRRIASYAANQSAYLWDATTGGQIGPLLRHDRPIEDVAFSPDNTLLLTTSHTRLQLWESATGSMASPPMVHPHPIARARWSPDGASIVSVDVKGRQREWRIAPTDRAVEDLAVLGRLYSAHRLTTGSALIPLNLKETKAAWEAGKRMEGR